MMKGVIDSLSKVFGANPRDLVPHVGVKYANNLAKSLVDRGFEYEEVGDKENRGYLFKMSNAHGMDITVAFGKSREFKESDFPGVYVSDRFSNTPFSVGIKSGKDSLYKNFEFSTPVNLSSKSNSMRSSILSNNEHIMAERREEGLLNKVYDILGMCESGDLYGLKKEFEVPKAKEKIFPFS